MTKSWDADPVVLTVAITGADVFRENNPNIPYTTTEIAESSIEAAKAGATVVHLHVREDDGTPSGRPELFKDVISRIRSGSEILTMVSSGGSNDSTIEGRPTGLDEVPGSQVGFRPMVVRTRTLFCSRHAPSWRPPAYPVSKSNVCTAAAVTAWPAG